MDECGELRIVERRAKPGPLCIEQSMVDAIITDAVARAVRDARNTSAHEYDIARRIRYDIATELAARSGARP